VTSPHTDGRYVPAATLVSLLLHVAAIAAIAVLTRESPRSLSAAIAVTLEAMAPAAHAQIWSSVPSISNVVASPEPATTAPADVPPPAFAAIESIPRTTPGVSVSMVASVPPPKPRNKTKAAPAPAQRNGEAAKASATAPVAESGDRPATVEAASPAVSTVAATPAPDLIVVMKPRFAATPSPPPYPPRARELAQEGEVVLRALVRRRGAAEQIAVWRSSGFRLLDQAALHAVSRWQFEPATQDGRETEAWVQVPVRFELKS